MNQLVLKYISKPQQTKKKNHLTNSKTTGIFDNSCIHEQSVYVDMVCLYCSYFSFKNPKMIMIHLFIDYKKTKKLFVSSGML